MPVRVRSQTGCVAIRAKAPVWRVSTNPSLKAGVSDGLTPVFTRTSLNWALVLVKTGISPDSACTEPVEAPDLQSVGQVETPRRVVSTSSDYLLSIPVTVQYPHLTSPIEGEETFFPRPWWEGLREGGELIPNIFHGSGGFLCLNFLF